MKLSFAYIPYFHFLMCYLLFKPFKSHYFSQHYSKSHSEKSSGHFSPWLLWPVSNIPHRWLLHGSLTSWLPTFLISFCLSLSSMTVFLNLCLYIMIKCRSSFMLNSGLVFLLLYFLFPQAISFRIILFSTVIEELPFFFSV